MDAERVNAQLDRILASAVFADAERARAFLRFVVKRALEGRTAEIKETVIAIEALGRKPSFDSKADPIVRVEARRVRERLTSYYEHEGKQDPVVIALPKGGYVPQFTQSRRVPRSALRLWLILFALVVGVFAWMRLREAPHSIGTLRLSILPPAGAHVESFAVSPDGRKVAFTAAVHGVSALWIRAFDSVDATPLAGTANATYPFWSPDSRSIGFYVPSKLKTIDIGGGPARDVADVIVGRGGDWSPAGVIAFARGPGVLYQAPATGGAPKPITSLDPARAEVAHGMPQFLPDGRHFLYLAASSRPGESSIRVGSLDATNSKVLLKADTGAAFAPQLPGHPGSLLFVHDGALIAQPFDTRRLELAGNPTIIIPQVHYRRWLQGGFSVSRNGVLLYQTGSPENRQLAWFDRNGKLLSEIGPHNRYSGFSLSPDESHVAVTRNDDPDTALNRIWVIDLLHGGIASRISDTGHAELEFAPVWSPKGGELLFSRGTGGRMRLLRQSLNGNPPDPVLENDGPKFSTDWSSDGRFLTYNSQWPDYQNMHVWVVSLGGGAGAEKPQAFLQHAHNEIGGCFSPSEGGRPPLWFAYSSDETGQFEVYVRDFPAGSRKWRVSSRGGWLPRWRPDGRELFYLSVDGTLMASAVRPGASFEFETPHALFETSLGMTTIQLLMNQYAVSRDGRRFLINRRLPDATSGAITAVFP